MSNFLLIAPDEWTQLDYTLLENSEPNFSPPNIARLAATTLYEEYFGVRLRELGMIPQDKTVLDVKLIDDTFFFVRLI